MKKLGLNDSVKYSDLNFKRTTLRICQITNCSNSKVYMNKEFNMLICPKHLAQLKRHGKILSRTRFDSNEIIIVDKDYAEILLYNKKNSVIARTKIDIEDIIRCKAHKWWLDRCYAVSEIDNRKVYLHRFIMDCINPNTIINHINFSTVAGKKNDSLDNRKRYLEEISENLNSRNMSLSKKNSSGYTGISYRKDANMWEAYITLDGRRKFLGWSTNINDAVILRLKAEKKNNVKTQSYLFNDYEINDNTDLSFVPEAPKYFKDKISVKFALDRAISKGTNAELTLEQFIQIKEYFRDSNGILRCAYCNQELTEKNEILEHVKSISSGGETTKCNIVVCCRSCNRAKGSKEFEVWYLKQSFYSKGSHNKIMELINNNEKYVNDNVIYIELILDLKKLKYFKGKDSDGKIFISNNQTQFAKIHNLSQTHIGRCLNINCNDRTCKGFSFTYLSRYQLINYFKSKGKIVLSLSKNYY